MSLPSSLRYHRGGRVGLYLDDHKILRWLVIEILSSLLLIQILSTRSPNATRV